MAGYGITINTITLGRGVFWEQGVHENYLSSHENNFASRIVVVANKCYMLS
jgi:hypothetical protein